MGIYYPDVEMARRFGKAVLSRKALVSIQTRAKNKVEVRIRVDAKSNKSKI